MILRKLCSAANMAAVLAMFLLAACGTPAKTTYYTLNPVPGNAPPTTTEGQAGKAGFSVSVGPVRIPEMVDRPPLVVRQGPNQVEVLEEHRWAESLQPQIARTLAADLGSRMGGVRVTASQDYASQHADYRIPVDIERFDAVPGEAVIIEAVWTIRGKTENPRIGCSVIREPVRSGSYEDIAAGYGRALAALSDEIAAGLQKMRAGGN
ncbi:PqiC family protein [Noviherbaspirillum massiliense]|uniref:PqiC family protein n=1 Tax=Noviherbaspirillum massiliense TaxID=1465823 RepID=UPI000306D0D1|nr:PqiC family protein [Noviherbaspirillum massiliense]